METCNVKWHRDVRMLGWLIVCAAALHVAEEWRGDFAGVMGRYVAGGTWMQFWVINALFVGACLAAAWRRERWAVLSVAVATLLLANTGVHVVVTAFLGKYNPGLVTALVLYLPLGILALAGWNRVLDAVHYRRGLWLGFVFLVVPGVVQLGRSLL